MLDIEKLNYYSKYFNLKQVCLISGVNYTNIENKLQRHRRQRETRLTEKETQRILEGLNKAGIVLKLLADC